MFAKPLRPLLRMARVGGTRTVRAYREPARFEEAIMNDMPKPEGCWQACYEEKQRKNNIHLAVGVIFTVVSFTMLTASGMVPLNSGVPELKK